MTKQELEKENKRLRLALLEIAHDTSEEEIEREGEREQRNPYACIVGGVRASAMYALYGNAYLFDRSQYMEKARKEWKEYESTQKKVQHP